MKARKFVLIYFKTVKATQSTQGKKTTARKKVNMRLKKMSSRQNKEKHGRKKKSWQIHWEPVMQVILKQFLCELWQFVI